MSAVLDIPVQLGHRAPLGRPRASARAADADFASLFARYEDRLLAFCRSILRDEQDARDALQNAALRALAGVRAGEVRSNPRAWLFAIARTESLMVLRRRRAVDSLDGTEPSPAGDPEARAIAREAFAELVADLEALAPQARQALVLREAAGLDYGEIAAILGCKAAAARQSVSEARAALKADREARGADCATIREILDAADGRKRRARSTRAHLRGCAACREWQAALPRRQRRLLLPPFLGFGWLETLLAGSRMEVAITAFSTPPRGVATAVATTLALGAAGGATVHKQSTHAARRAPVAVVTAAATPRTASVETAAPAAAAPTRAVTAVATVVVRHRAASAPQAVATPSAGMQPQQGRADRDGRPDAAPPSAAADEPVAADDPPPTGDDADTGSGPEEPDHRSAARSDGHTDAPWDSSIDSAVAGTSPSASPSNLQRSHPDNP